MITDLYFYLAAIPAGIIVGLSKGGFAGLGVLGVPILALVVSPVQAASILMPILLVQDAVSVWNFRRALDVGTLKLMLPGAVIGITAGFLLAAYVKVAAVELAIGVVALAFGAQRLWASRAITLAVKDGPHPWVGFVCAVVSVMRRPMPAARRFRSTPCRSASLAMCSSAPAWCSSRRSTG